MILSLREAADRLGVTARALNHRIERGHMTAQKVGTAGWVVTVEEVERQKLLGRLKPGPVPRQDDRARVADYRPGEPYAEGEPS